MITDTDRLNKIAESIKDPEQYDLVIFLQTDVYINRNGATILDHAELGSGRNLRAAIDDWIRKTEQKRSTEDDG